MTTFCPLCNIPFADPFPVAPLAWRLKAPASLHKHGVSFELAATGNRVPAQAVSGSMGVKEEPACSL
jgi:hypothetical protein